MPDDMDFDDVDDTDTPAPSGQDRNFKRLREAARAEKEAREAAETRLAELEASQAATAAEARKVELKMAATAAGLPAEFVSVVPAGTEATKEALVAFAQSIGYLAAEAPAPGAPETPAPRSGFVPLTAGGTGVSGRISYEEFQVLLQTQPQKAEAAYEAGLVDGLPKPQVGGALGSAERYQFEIPIEHYRPGETERRLKAPGA